MIDLLNFIFQDFWHWSGATITLYIIILGVKDILNKIIILIQAQKLLNRLKDLTTNKETK